MISFSLVFVVLFYLITFIFLSSLAFSFLDPTELSLTVLIPFDFLPNVTGEGEGLFWGGEFNDF